MGREGPMHGELVAYLLLAVSVVNVKGVCKAMISLVSA